MNRLPWKAPRSVAPVKTLYQDVTPEELAHEEMRERAAWPLYLRRMLGREDSAQEASAAG